MEQREVALIRVGRLGRGAYAGLRGNGIDVGVAPVNPDTATTNNGTGTVTETLVPGVPPLNTGSRSTP